MVGRALILIGAMVWLIYGVVWLIGGEPQVGHYLPVHLSGVLPGAVLARWPLVNRWFRGRR